MVPPGRFGGVQFEKALEEGFFFFFMQLQDDRIKASVSPSQVISPKSRIKTNRKNPINSTFSDLGLPDLRVESRRGVVGGPTGKE